MDNQEKRTSSELFEEIRRTKSILKIFVGVHSEQPSEELSEISSKETLIQRLVAVKSELEEAAKRAKAYRKSNPEDGYGMVNEQLRDIQIREVQLNQEREALLQKEKALHAQAQKLALLKVNAVQSPLEEVVDRKPLESMLFTPSKPSLSNVTLDEAFVDRIADMMDKKINA